MPRNPVIVTDAESQTIPPVPAAQIHGRAEFTNAHGIARIIVFHGHYAYDLDVWMARVAHPIPGYNPSDPGMVPHGRMFAELKAAGYRCTHAAYETQDESCRPAVKVDPSAPIGWRKGERHVLSIAHRIYRKGWRTEKYATPDEINARFGL